MGFRNPITSATAVDTGQGPKGAGVRLYQDTSNPAVPAGVAEWRTGLMDRNATATLSGGGSGGSVFALSGGSTQGVAAPEVRLDVEPMPAGGYGAVARIAGAAATYFDGVTYPSSAAQGVLPQLGPAITEWTTDDFTHLRYYLLENGLVFVSGFVLCNGTSTGQITAHGGAYAPLHVAGRGQRHLLSGSVSDVARSFEARADGIYLRGAVPNNGNFLALQGLYPSAVRTG